MKTIDLLARQMPTTRLTRLPRPDHPHSREGLCGVGPNTLKLEMVKGQPKGQPKGRPKGRPNGRPGGQPRGRGLEAGLEAGLKAGLKGWAKGWPERPT